VNDRSDVYRKHFFKFHKAENAGKVLFKLRGK